MAAFAQVNGKSPRIAGMRGPLRGLLPFLHLGSLARARSRAAASPVSTRKQSGK
jgi:hypothetical protein